MRFNTFFFSRSVISLGFKTSMSFLLENARECQSYFCFNFELVLGLAATSVNFRSCTEICQGPAKVDAAPSPHFFSRNEGVASTPAAKVHNL